MASTRCPIFGGFHFYEKLIKREESRLGWGEGGRKTDGGHWVLYLGAGWIDCGGALSCIHATTPSINLAYNCKQRRIQGLIHPTHVWVGAGVDELIHPSIRLEQGMGIICSERNVCFRVWMTWGHSVHNRVEMRSLLSSLNLEESYTAMMGWQTWSIIPTHNKEHPPKLWVCSTRGSSIQVLKSEKSIKCSNFLPPPLEGPRGSLWVLRCKISSQHFPLKNIKSDLSIDVHSIYQI